VRIGNVEAKAGRRQVFGAVAKADTDLGALIRRSLDSVGGTDGTTLTAFTDGCPGLRRILLDGGVVELPILDWFHPAMRLPQPTQTAGSLSSDDPERAAAKAVIFEEVDRLHWRLWNGKAKNARISIDRLRAVMHHFRGERDGPSRRVSCAQQIRHHALCGRRQRVGGEAFRHSCRARDLASLHAVRLPRRACRLSLPCAHRFSGSNLLLNTITAVVVGVSLYGGKGSIRNAVVGTLLLASLSNLMNMLLIPPAPQDPVNGLIILVAIMINLRLDRG
jgi:hypothetical protein